MDMQDITDTETEEMPSKIFCNYDIDSFHAGYTACLRDQRARRKSGVVSLFVVLVAVLAIITFITFRNYWQ